MDDGAPAKTTLVPGRAPWRTPRRRTTWLVAVAVAVAAVLSVLPVAGATGSSDQASASPTTNGPPPSGPCGRTKTPPRYRHVVWVIMENRGFDDVVGSSSAPYLTSLANSCGLAADYSGVAHPSLPNYLALTSGSVHGVGDDAGPSTHPLGGPSIFSLLGPRWRVLAQAMPAPCDRSNSDVYAVRHDPAAYYMALGPSCRHQDIPLGASPDISAAFTMIIPDLCNDMHDCSTATGDNWLKAEMGMIESGPTYRAGTTAVFITWDENDSGGSLVPTYVVAPSVRPGARSAAAFDHYSLLRTTEELLHLHPLLGQAASASSMASAFDL